MNDPDAEKIYCYVPWTMTDYPDGSFYSIRQDIDDMDCYMKFAAYRGKRGRVTIWGIYAREAWFHFLKRTKEVIPAKVPMYDEFYEKWHIVRNDPEDDKPENDPEDDPHWDPSIKAGWLLIFCLCLNNLQFFFTKQ